eukprot:3882267-Amphidinium_carterae.1
MRQQHAHRGMEPAHLAKLPSKSQMAPLCFDDMFTQIRASRSCSILCSQLARAALNTESSNAERQRGYEQKDMHRGDARNA